LNFFTNILKNYSFYYMAHDGSNVGGVGIYVRNCYSCNVLKDFCIPTTDNIKVEDLWFEIQHGTKKYVIGGIYRHPNQHSITNFCQHLDSILGKVSKSKTPCIIAGDCHGRVQTCGPMGACIACLVISVASAQ